MKREKKKVERFWSSRAPWTRICFDFTLLALFLFFEKSSSASMHWLKVNINWKKGEHTGFFGSSKTWFTLFEQKKWIEKKNCVKNVWVVLKINSILSEFLSLSIDFHAGARSVYEIYWFCGFTRSNVEMKN